MLRTSFFFTLTAAIHIFKGKIGLRGVVKVAVLAKYFVFHPLHAYSKIDFVSVQS